MFVCLRTVTCDVHHSPFELARRGVEALRKHDVGVVAGGAAKRGAMVAKQYEMCYVGCGVGQRSCTADVEHSDGLICHDDGGRDGCGMHRSCRRKDTMPATCSSK